MTDGKGVPIAFSDIEAGNHNDLYNISSKVRIMIRSLLKQGFTLLKSILIADKGFDCLALRNLLRRFRIKALIKVNLRNSKKTKRGRKKYFDGKIYTTRYINERTFAWMDSYRTLLIRFDTTTESWRNWHFIAGFLMIAKV